jgi:pimeloyl-ACP methyl ester carboxylesterase
MESIRSGAPFDPSQVRVPVVCGYGSVTEDRHRASTTALAAAVPDGELITIEGAAHGAHLSHPRDFASFVRRVVAHAGAS